MGSLALSPGLRGGQGRGGGGGGGAIFKACTNHYCYKRGNSIYLSCNGFRKLSLRGIRIAERFTSC